MEIGEATYQRWERGSATPYPRHKRRLCEIFAARMEELGLGEEKSALSCRPLRNDAGNIASVKRFMHSDLQIRLSGIVNTPTYTKQQEMFLQVMNEFDAMNTNNPNYRISRREALAHLAILPFVSPLNLLEKSNGISSSHHELFLRQCGASLTACEAVSHGSESEASDFLLAFQCVSRYLGELQTIIASSSRYRKQAIELAAHGAILKTMLGWRCAGDAAALSFAHDAVPLACESGDRCLQLSAYSKLSWAYLYDQRPDAALKTAREARDILEQHKGKLPSCIRGGTYSTLAVMQARNHQSPDTALKKAVEQDPGNDIIAHMEFTQSITYLEQGDTLSFAGKPVEALQSYAHIVDPDTLAVTAPFQKTFTERGRWDTILSMSRAALKGEARDLEKAVCYWEATMEGAKRLKNESLFSGALTTYDMMELAFPGERSITNLLDLIKHW